MGGLCRTINGSYAEYTRAPVTNVAAIESGLSWADLAALPETYATAWTCLFRNLEIAPGQTLVVRGATSSLGQAALNLAVNSEAKVIASTRSRDRFPMLEALGAVRAEVETPDLSNMNTSEDHGLVVLGSGQAGRNWTVAARMCPITLTMREHERDAGSECS